MYQAIVFDLDGTPLDFDTCAAHASREAFREVGFEVSDAASWTRIWEVFAPIGSSYWGRRAEKG